MQQNLTSLFASIPAQPRLDRPALRAGWADRDTSVSGENGNRRPEFSVPADPQDRGRVQEGRRSRAGDSRGAERTRDTALRRDPPPRRDDPPGRSERPSDRDPPRRLDPPRRPGRSSDAEPPRRTDPPGLNKAANQPVDAAETTMAASDDCAQTTGLTAMQTADESSAQSGTPDSAAVAQAEIALSDSQTVTPDTTKTASTSELQASGQPAAEQPSASSQEAGGETAKPANPALQATGAQASTALDEVDGHGDEGDKGVDDHNLDESGLNRRLTETSAPAAQAQVAEVPGGAVSTNVDRSPLPASSEQAFAPVGSMSAISAANNFAPAGSALSARPDERVAGPDATSLPNEQAPAEKRSEGADPAGAKGAAISLKEVVTQARPAHLGETAPSGTPAATHSTVQAAEAATGPRSPAKPEHTGLAAAEPVSATPPAVQATSPSLAPPSSATSLPGFNLPHVPHTASAPIRVVAEVPIGAVPVEIGLKSLAGVNHFEIRLDPAELGRIEVRLDIDKDGGVKAHLTVDRLETLALLQRDSRTLERAFEQAGLKPTDGSVDLSLRDPQSGPPGQGRQDQGDQRRDGSRPGNPDLPRDDARPALAESSPYRIWRGAAGVDVRI
jgi:flagellar hook-length control protein FliK